MNLLWLLLVEVLAVAVVVSGLVLLADRWRDRRRLYYRRVMVHIAGSRETTFEGILWRQSARLVVLRDAHTFDLGRGGMRVPLDGEVVLERHRIEWIHVPAGGGHVVNGQ